MKNLIAFLLLSSTLSFGQQTEKLDVLEINASIKIDTLDFKVNGHVQVKFKILQNIDSVYLDGVNMTITPTENSPYKIVEKDNKVWITSNFKKNTEHTAKFSFKAQPKQALYFVGFNSNLQDYPSQVWTQGQGKYTSNWLPSLDDMNDKIVFNITYHAPKNYEVIANGSLKRKKKEGSQRSWRFEMDQPMSSYLVGFAMGSFSLAETTTENGTPLQLYLENRHLNQANTTFKHYNEIFNLLENKINIKYPWANFKQVPVRDFLYAGMENTTLNIFSEEFVVDSIGVNDKSFVNVQAHELAHQWFGNLVTETSSKHHWLHEGFATYYALQVEREVFGEDYYYYKLYKSAEELKALSDSGKGQVLVHTGGSSLTYYEKGAWALVILNEIVGEEVFQKTIKSYLTKYAFKNVTTEDFMNEVELHYGGTLVDFENRWLYQKAFQSKESLEFLKQNEFIKNYLELAALRETRLGQKSDYLSKALDFPVNDYLGQEAVYQLNDEDLKLALPLYEKAFETNNIYVRQAIASSLSSVPKTLQSAYISLLEDPSYVTIEKALLHLWMSFPDDRHSLLDQTKDIVGFQDKNVRLLWLTLNLATPDYQPQNKSKVFDKLSSYTQSGYPYQIRRHAFGYLYQIDTFTTQNYMDVMQGVFHPVWQFKKFCRELLDTLMASDKHASAIKKLVNTFTVQEKTFFNNRY